MSDFNGEVTQAEYIRYLEITIPATGGTPATLWDLIVAASPGLTDVEKERILQVVIKDHGAEFEVGDTDDLSEKNETVEATGVYTEPCLGAEDGFLGKTYFKSKSVALTPLCKVYIGQAPNDAANKPS